MESKAIIDAYCRIRTIDNTIPDDVLDFMKDASLSHSTLIAEHNMMKDSLEYIAYYDKNASGKKASETLKQITL